MKKIFITSALLLSSVAFFVSCGGKTEGEGTTTETTESTEATPATEEKAPANPESYDPKRGEGKYDAANLTIGALDVALATKGEAIANTKCLSCHKLTDEKLVGPGWKGVSERRTPHWIMNFITNPDPMLDKDPELQAQLELCLVRMPNQNLTDDDARNVFEFMRKNDGAK